MRILQIINTLGIGGAERLLTDVLPIMSQHHHVELLVLQDCDSYFMDKLKDMNITIHSLNMENIYNPFTIWKMRGFFKKNLSFDIIHVHLFPSQYWVAICKWLFRLQIPLITTEHNATNTRFNYKFTTWTDRWIYHLYETIICISDGVNQAMTKRVQGKVRTKTINNGINIKKFSNAIPCKRADFSIPKDAIILMQVARFEEQKNQECVIRALKRLPKNVYLIFVGDGVRMEYCKSVASQMGVKNRTRFLGVRRDIAELWSMVDIGIMSSHWEGFGLSILEAMAAGKPVLATYVDGLSDVIGNPDLCFPDEDDKILAEKILKFITNDKYRTQIAEYCIERASLFSIEKMENDLLSEYQYIISEY